MSGDRPTSGKHFARMGPGKLSEMQYLRTEDDNKSYVANKFAKTREVESLLSKLAGYMSGSIAVGDLEKEVSNTHNDQQPVLPVTQEPKRSLGLLKNLEPVSHTLISTMHAPKPDPVSMNVDNSDYEIEDELHQI